MDSPITARSRVRYLLQVLIAGFLISDPAIAVDEMPAGTLIADGNDGAVTYQVIDNDGDLVFDIEVTGAASGNGIYEDIDTIDSTAATSPGSIIIGVSASTTTTVSNTNAGTLTRPERPPLDFSGIENLTGGANNDTFVLDANLSGLVDGGPGSDTVVGRSTSNAFIVSATDGGVLDTTLFTSIENLIGGSSADMFTLNAALSGTAQGNAGDDEFVLNVGGSAGALNGGAGVDVIFGADAGNAFVFNAADVGTANGTLFSSIESIVGGSAADVFSLNINSVSSTLDGGAGADELTFAGAAGPVTLSITSISNIETLTGSGNTNDTLTGTTAGDIFTVLGANSGSLGSVNFSGFENLEGSTGDDQFNLGSGGSVGSLDGGTDTDQIVGYDTGTAFVVDSLNAGTVNGTAFSNVENLSGGSASDTFDFNATLSGAAQSGAGDDTFNLNDGGSAGGFDGGVDNDTVSYAGRTAGVTTDLSKMTFVENVVGSGLDDTFNLDGDQGNGITIDGGAGGDLFNVAAASQVAGDLVATNIDQVLVGADVTANNITLNVDGPISGIGTVTAAGDITMTLIGGGDAALQFGGNGSGGILSLTSTGGGVLGLSATGGSGSDTLKIIVAGSQPAWDINATNAGTVSDALIDIDFSGIENLIGAGDGNTFILNAGIDGLIDGGDGLDTIIGSAADNVWDISTPNAGTVTSTIGAVDFTRIENLTGGAAADTFVLSAAISGVIDGGAGFDTIIGAAGPNSFVVNAIDAGTVNLIEFFNVEILVGGVAGDTFTFDAPLTGNADGGGGDDVFDLAPDTQVWIDGGAGNDQVIIVGPNTNDLGLNNVENINYIPVNVVFVARGTVNSVPPDLASEFTVGDSFEFRYKFAAQATDTQPAVDQGQYDAVVEAEVHVGSYSADLAPTGLKRITVQDNLSGIDRYRVDLSGVTGPAVAGFPLGQQFPMLLVSDFTGTALNSDSLPIAGLDVSDFGQNDFLSLRFERPDESNAIVVASVDSIEVIPAYRDVPDSYWAADFVAKIAENGITGGCGSVQYCPDDEVTRAQMAVFLERGINGGDFVPPAASGNVFFDVGVQDFAAAFIEQLANDGITGGCGGGNYCPNDTVTRAQMAVFLLRAKYGPGYSPPPAQGIFADVDLAYWAVAWIEQLFAEGITSGCGDGNYCPNDPATRAQMAVFLVRTFNL